MGDMGLDTILRCAGIDVEIADRKSDDFKLSTSTDNLKPYQSSKRDLAMMAFMQKLWTLPVGRLDAVKRPQQTPTKPLSMISHYREKPRRHVKRK